MGPTECFGPSAAIGVAFLELKTELRASDSLYPAVEQIARYWVQIQYAIELHAFTLLMVGLHPPETVRRVGDVIRRRYRDSLHLPRMGRATLMTGPHTEQSVGFRQGSSSAAPVMTEQAFTLAMGDLRPSIPNPGSSTR
eukprot:3906728-Pleurochrysis_carterae.AAC.1